jgi:hypothetical protein
VTEAEWLACTDPQGMLHWVRSAHRPGERKLRLFACACCRRAWHLLTREPPRAAVEAAERYADGLAGPEELRQGWSAVRKALSTAPLGTPWEEALVAALYAATPGPFPPEGAAGAAANALSGDPRPRGPYHPLTAKAGEAPGCPSERAFQCALLRDLFAPFGAPEVGACWLTWGGGAVAALARGAYEDRQLPSGQLDPARLAVLADALEDVGCTDQTILSHLRGPGPHLRGCWVLDLLLGKE